MRIIGCALPASAVAQVAGALAAEIAKQAGVAIPGLAYLGGACRRGSRNGSPSARKDLLRIAAPSLVVAGYRQPLAVHLLAHAINAALGNLGKTVVLQPKRRTRQSRGLGELAQALNGGQVETLVILGGNPGLHRAGGSGLGGGASARPRRSFGWATTKTRRLRGCHWHLPAAHYLESWGDALAQRWHAGAGSAADRAVVRRADRTGSAGAHWRSEGRPAPTTLFARPSPGYARAADFEEAWKKFLHDGFLANSAAKPVAATLQCRGRWIEALADVKASAPGKGQPRSGVPPRLQPG